MKNIILPILLLCCGQIWSQKHDYVWMVGQGGTNGVAPLYNTTRINFNDQPFTPENIEIDMKFSGSCISLMSDTAGNLLFYTNGCYIANAAGDTIEGGGLLNYAAGPGFQEDCEYNHGYQIVWGAVSVPVSPEEGLYAIIHKDKMANWSNPSNAVFAWNLYATYVDMSQNNGAGKVTKKKVLISDTLSYSDVTACRHTNGKDWWLMAMGDKTRRFYKFLLQKDTVLGPFIQEIGDIMDGGYDICQAVYSPDGTQYARVNWCNGVMLYDFDRSTGTLSNYRNFTYGCAANSDSVKLCGVGFSPSSRYLYVSGWLKMYQLDTQAPDLQASAKLLGVYDGYRDTVAGNTLVPQPFYVMANAPDCKIYVTAPRQGRTFHVIHEPDLAAPDCLFQQHAFRLPTYRTYNIPNFAHYRLGTGASVCDSTLSVVNAIWGIPYSETGVHLYPNPSAGPVYVDIDIGHHKSAEFQVFSIDGSLVFSDHLDNLRFSYDFDLSRLNDGVYFFRAVAGDGLVLGTGRIVMLK
jgi:Secretion system C-terminal sorting domain